MQLSMPSQMAPALTGVPGLFRDWRAIYSHWSLGFFLLNLSSRLT